LNATRWFHEQGGRLIALISLIAFIAVVAGAAALGGCAAPGKAAFSDPALTVQSARERIVPGQSTRADVFKALGPATVITFDSGFEVWAYRSASPSAQRVDTELVILLDRDGLVKKTRLRLPGG
jgi:hypothetical protein